MTNKISLQQINVLWIFIMPYPELSLGFQGILKARCGYKLDVGVAKAANAKLHQIVPNLLVPVVILVLKPLNTLVDKMSNFS